MTCDVVARGAWIGPQVAALKENCDQQARHIQHQARALDEMRREGQQDVAMAYRLNYGAERRAATMQARLGVAAADQERAFAAAASQLEAMRRERDTLAEALAAVAEAAVGGQEATAAELASEARAAEDEGSDPLPRRPDSWVKFNYYVPPAHARRLASQVSLHATPPVVLRLEGRARSMAYSCKTPYDPTGHEHAAVEEGCWRSSVG